MSTIIQSKKTLLTVALGGAIAIVLAFGSFSTVSAQALTQSQIDSILGLLESFGADEATMNDVEAALTGEDTDDTTPTTPAPDVAQFDRDLSTGSTGDDVKSLQEWLNDNGYTVATEGAGSPGNETDYFGERTREAVAAYQSANGIEPVAGYFGPKTREAVNAEIEDAVEDDDDDATDDDDDDATDDDDDADDDADDDEDVVAREGVLTAEARSDYRNVEVGANQTKNVATYRMEAEDSDIEVERIDLYVENEEEDDHNKSLMDFRSDIDHLAIKVDGDVVAETDVDRSTIGRDDDFIRFSGLSIDVEQDDYVDFTIEVTAADDEDLDATYEIGPDDDDGEGAIRGVDTAGLQNYDNAEKRDFKLIGEEKGELDASRNDNTPEEGLVLIDADEFEEVHLLSFDLEVGEDDLDLETLTVAIEEAGFGGVAQDILLKEGSSVLGVENDDDEVEFTDLDMELAEDETLTLDVYADVEVSDVDEQGGYLKASVKADDNKDIGYDMSDNEIDLDGDANGYEQSVYVTAPTAELGEYDNDTNTDEDTANAYMHIDVTALGGDVYFLGETAMSVVDESDWDTEYDYSDFDDDSVGSVIVDDDSGDMVLDGNNEPFSGDEEDVSATTTDSLEQLNDALVDLGYETGDFVNVINVGTAGDDGVYEVGDTDATDHTTDHGTDTLYYLAEEETSTVEINGVNRDGNGWVRLKINAIEWYAQDEDGGYHLDDSFTKEMDDIDALETDQVNITNPE